VGTVAGGATVVVVSILCAIAGDKTAFGDVSGNTQALRRALQTLAADVKVEEGELLVGAEVLWTPSDPDEVLTKRDLILDYPELIDL